MNYPGLLISSYLFALIYFPVLNIFTKQLSEKLAEKNKRVEEQIEGEGNRTNTQAAYEIFSIGTNNHEFRSDFYRRT